MNEKIECPYCESYVSLEDISVFGESDKTFDYECPYCSKEFEVTVEFNPTFSASEIIYETCKDCGREFRENGKRYPKPEKYNHLKGSDYIICHKCFERETFLELKKKYG